MSKMSFSNLPKFPDWETILDTLGDALSLNCILHGFYRNFNSPPDKTTHPINIKGHGRLRDPIDKKHINTLLFFMFIAFTFVSKP